MWRAGILACGLAAACTPRSVTVDLCAVTPLPDAARVVVVFVDAAGIVVGTVDRDAAAPSAISIPAHAATIEVEAVDRDGNVVAQGATALGTDDPCVCVAPQDQCAGMTCSVTAGACSFRSTGQPDLAGPADLGNPDLQPETLVFGGIGGPPGALDTTIGGVSPETVQDQSSELDVEGDATYPTRAVLRFALAEIPSTATIVSAELALFVTRASTNATRVVAVAEDWVPAEATWTYRRSGVPWLAPGCGPASQGAPVGNILPTVVGARPTLPLTDVVAAWVSGARPNHGLLLDYTGGIAAAYASSEVGGIGPPQLTVTFRR